MCSCGSNGDGHLDVAFGGWYPRELYLGNGTGGFAKDETSKIGLGDSTTESIAIGDLCALVP